MFDLIAHRNSMILIKSIILPDDKVAKVTKIQTMIIRKAKPEELSILCAFQQQMALETEKLHLDENTLSSGIQAVFNDPSKGCYYVAEEGNKIVGMLLITYEWSDWRNRTVYWIQSVYVLPEHRRQGVYKALYEHILNQAKESHSVGGIRLYVDNSNHQAKLVYTRSGMNGDHYQVFEWMK